MPTFTGNPLNSWYKRLLQIGNSDNSGTPTAITNIQSGDGTPTVLSFSDDELRVQPQNDDTTRVFNVRSTGGDTILGVNTTDSTVNAGAKPTNVLTQYKEMGLFDFSPTAGYHNPLIAHNMMFSDSGADIIEDTSMFSNGGDPAAILDLSANGTPMIAIACYWYLENDITLDRVRFLATAAGSDNLAFHIEAYDMDVSSNHGDLSNGTTHANASVAATSSTVKTGTFSLDTANIDTNKIVIGFCESDSTTNFSVTFQIQYHIR